MNWVDLIIILIVALFAVEGFRKGFFNQIFNILGFLFSLILALTFYSYVANVLISQFNIPLVAANPLGFLTVWIFTESAFFGVLRFFAGNYYKNLAKKKINKYLGFMPASLNAVLFLSFALLFIVSLPIRPDIKQDIYDAKIGSFLVTRVTALEKPLNKVFGPIAKQGLTFLTVRPGETESINLQFTQSDLSTDHSGERQMFDLVNNERQKLGIKPLAWSEPLAEVGRQHSKDMFERGYFSHYSPQGKDVGDRLFENGIDYSVAGENLALAPNVQRAHTGLMNSEGHRRNILDPRYTKIGIGAQDGNVYGKMFTQVFTE